MISLRWGILFLVALPALAAPDATKWVGAVGGGYWDYFRCIRSTADGGYIISGQAEPTFGNTEAWCTKTDADGKVIWKKTYGGSDFDIAYRVEETSDRGFIVAGTTDSFGAGSRDAWIYRLDKNGKVKWQKTYGGSVYDTAYGLTRTTDGGYMVVGESSSFGAGYMDAWCLKLDANGALQWARALGGADQDSARSVVQAGDGGYVFAGYTESSGAGDKDLWCAKLDSTGSLVWSKTFGGTDEDYANEIQKTADGGFVIGGYTESFGKGYSDAWVIKLNSDGGVAWQRTYGASNFEEGYSILQLTDGSYMLAADTYSFGSGLSDFWFVKLTSTGGITWQTTVGGSQWDTPQSVQQTTDSGFVFAGWSSTYGVDAYDGFLARVTASGQSCMQGKPKGKSASSKAVPANWFPSIATVSLSPKPGKGKAKSSAAISTSVCSQ